MILFLDVDGVLHPLLAHKSKPMSCLPRLAAVLWDFPEVQVVITSTWRLTRSLEDLRALFPADLRSRVIGATAAPGYEPRPGARQYEALLWLDGYDPASQWIALDDYAPHYFSSSRLVLCDHTTGFGEDEEKQLRERLVHIRQFGNWDDYQARVIALFGAADTAVHWLNKPMAQFKGASLRDLYDTGRLQELDDLLIRAHQHDCNSLT